MSNKHQVLALLQRNTAAANLVEAVDNLTATAKDSANGLTTINTRSYETLLGALDQYREVIAATYPAAFRGDTPDGTIDVDLYNSAAQAKRDLQAALSWQRAVPLEAIDDLSGQSTLMHMPAARHIRAWLIQAGYATE